MISLDTSTKRERRFAVLPVSGRRPSLPAYPSMSPMTSANVMRHDMWKAQLQHGWLRQLS